MQRLLAIVSDLADASQRRRSADLASSTSPDEVRELHDRVVAANRLRVPAYVSLATSGALLLGFLFAEEGVSMWDGRLQADVLASTVHGIDPHYLHDLHRLSTWSDVRYTMFGGMICAAMVTTFLWSKSSTDFMLDASANDLSVSFHTKF